MASKNDPRDSSLEVKMSFPKTWNRDGSDPLSVSGMFLAGLIMVTRNRYLAWPAILLAFNAYINQHPLRTKEGSGNALMNLMMCIMALIASYFPLFVVSNSFNVAQSP
ncbi:hypothetical protein PLEOSDRAFT_1060688 [Pleurotus ostreatus PC15]|uniref:Protein Asterix n=1 Tax=Pleurotus ostreatus (strain PC15) TaxID=1137138 RepID=A0A067NYL8_PLEO1|nr:hypothetical protein PLEOSDRAFT_1060688 [Pleurotus ostreatus PC15]